MISALRAQLKIILRKFFSGSVFSLQNLKNPTFITIENYGTWNSRIDDQQIVSTTVRLSIQHYLVNRLHVEKFDVA